MICVRAFDGQSPHLFFQLNSAMNTILRPDIHWVGYVDWIVRDFHGYDTEHGTTYNAYLVRDEKTALIDTVKAPYAEDLLEAGSRRRTAGQCDTTLSAIMPSRTTRAGCRPSWRRFRGPRWCATPSAGRRWGSTSTHRRGTSRWSATARRSASAAARSSSSTRPWSTGPSRCLPTCRRRSCCSRWTPSASTTPAPQRFDDEVPLETVLGRGEDLLREHRHALRQGRGALPGEARRAADRDDRPEPRR